MKYLVLFFLPLALVGKVNKMLPDGCAEINTFQIEGDKYFNFKIGDETFCFAQNKHCKELADRVLWGTVKESLQVAQFQIFIVETLDGHTEKIQVCAEEALDILFDDNIVVGTQL